MNGFVLAKKILRTGYYWMTMENDCSKFVQKCHKCQIHGDLIKIPRIELNAMTSPWPQMNEVVEAANEKIKKILRKMIDNYKDWNSTGASPYLLVYGTEAVIPAEVEIPSLRIIQVAELDDAEWIRKRYEQLALIDEKRMIVVCHGQLYQQRMAPAFNKHGNNSEPSEEEVARSNGAKECMKE
ncbi:uncharacterized protein LOC132065987 [Lycium ferocissimum]|uniref:uncharacterized protein LOC132065987 n=1 Tax=Lycium ferocissimum TaxID=112874 RepID=UPI0028157043|nr:uncharacterized protein LOC132065987 [Lycium ferocissimum]